MKNLGVWQELKKVITDDDLKNIANADDGFDFYSHYQELIRIFETGLLPERLGWEPREVLSQTINYRYWESGVTETQRVLFCAIILLSAAEYDESKDLILSQPDNIITAIDCSVILGGAWIEHIYRFFKYLTQIVKIENVEEDLIYFKLGHFLTAKIFHQPVDDISTIINSIINAELTVSKYLKRGPYEDILGYTFNNQKVEVWGKYLKQGDHKLKEARKKSLKFTFQNVQEEAKFREVKV